MNSFISFLWLLLCHRSRIELLQLRQHSSQSKIPQYISDCPRTPSLNFDALASQSRITTDYLRSPGAQQQGIHLQCKRPRFDPWVRKIPWRRERPPTPDFLPGESHGQRSLAGFSPWVHRESDTAAWLNDKLQPHPSGPDPGPATALERIHTDSSQGPGSAGPQRAEDGPGRTRATRGGRHHPPRWEPGTIPHAGSPRP